MTKTGGSASEPGSISQRHGSADPDPYQNVMDPQHWYREYLILTLSCEWELHLFVTSTGEWVGDLARPPILILTLLPAPSIQTKSQQELPAIHVHQCLITTVPVLYATNFLKKTFKAASYPKFYL
jgi:hypothetical protein